MDYIKQFVQVYDNKGETADRYTVIIEKNIFSMSDDALSPQGVNMYSHDATDDDFDSSGNYISKMTTEERVENLSTLPPDVLTAIIQRLLSVFIPETDDNWILRIGHGRTMDDLDDDEAAALGEDISSSGEMFGTISLSADTEIEDEDTED